MIPASAFMAETTSMGFSIWSGVPCSYLSPLINHVIDSDDLQYVGAANEGDAVAIASGAALAGRRGVAMFQNSGLGNAVSPLTSLIMVFRIPVLLIVTLRGEPGGPPDEPQHAVMGGITTSLLELMGIAWEHFPDEEHLVRPAVQRAIAHMDGHGTPYAFVMRKGAVATTALRSRPLPRPPAAEVEPRREWLEDRPTRAEVLACIQAATTENDLVVATTGYTGRELYALDDRANQLYMVGSMGCAASLGLGVAVAQPHRRVVVVDGDGALLMRLGVLATLGYEQPPNLVHLLLDNERHESTGGQSTVAHSVDLAATAASCGYTRVTRAASVDDVRRALDDHRPELTFVHVKIRPGVRDDLPRPSVTPAEVADRVRELLAGAPVPGAVG
jgi:phosphonopyruvate decarboxylase